MKFSNITLRKNKEKYMETNILEYEEYKRLLENPLWHLCRSNTENAISNFWAYLIYYTCRYSVIMLY